MERTFLLLLKQTNHQPKFPPKMLDQMLLTYFYNVGLVVSTGK